MGSVNDDDEHELFDVKIGDRYRIVRKIGSGAFGQIYLGIEEENGAEVAVKLEERTHQLHLESKVLAILKHQTGFPNLRFFGKERHYNVLVMDLTGPTIEDLFNVCGRSFSLKTILMLIDQLISRIECIHSRGIIHRDIKPDNLCMGLGKESSTVIMIDFGLSKCFLRAKTQKHISYRQDRGLVGTPRYCSRRAHIGIELTRRDDLESLSYVLIYLLKARLPWQDIKGANKLQKLDKISERKNTIRIEKYLKGYPMEFCIFINYCRQLRFDELPDYMFLRNLFRCLFRVWNLKWDSKYDWTQENKTGRKRTESLPNNS